MPSTTLATPLGDVRIVVRDRALERIDFLDGHTEPADSADGRDTVLAAVCAQLEEYFAAARRHFDLPLRLHGTPFQLGVWERLCDIGYGQTISYGELARRLGKPGAARAVGLANGRNPIPIVVPCHRVIGSDGSLTGYGGGMPRKQALLELEGALTRASGEQAALF